MTHLKVFAEHLQKFIVSFVVSLCLLILFIVWNAAWSISVRTLVGADPLKAIV